jgi:hypothetical protein
MALTDSNSPPSAFDPAPLRDIPYAALAQLPVLHGQARRDIRLAAFLARSPQASMILMLAGAVTLLAGGGATLKADFAWAALVLLGIVAMTRNYIRGFARSLRRMPLEEAASDLRTLLLFTGAAWGAGAFLVMPALPSPGLAIAFAVAPSLALDRVLKDARGTLAFVLPATLTAASGAILGAWPADIWVCAAIIVSGAAIAILAMLRRDIIQ